MTKEKKELSLDELKKCERILSFGAPIPSWCPKCGHPEYKYLILHAKGGIELLQAVCRRCRYSRYWNPVRGWTIPGEQWHNPSMVDDADRIGELLYEPKPTNEEVDADVDEVEEG